MADGASAISLPAGARVWRAKGCPACANTGYVGRVGVYETVRIDERVRRLITENGDEAEIAAIGREAGGSLAQSAREAVLAGVTTVEEALRTTRQEAAGHGEL